MSIKKTTLCIFVYIFIFIYADPAISGIYYIASNGNDGNSGQSISSPWQTIAKVNSMMSTFTPVIRYFSEKAMNFLEK